MILQDLIIHETNRFFIDNQELEDAGMVSPQNQIDGLKEEKKEEGLAWKKSKILEKILEKYLQFASSRHFPADGNLKHWLSFNDCVFIPQIGINGKIVTCYKIKRIYYLFIIYSPSDNLHHNPEVNLQIK